MIGPLLIGLVAAVTVQAPSSGPHPRALHLVPAGDTVFVYLTSAPPAGGGFEVYRGLAGDSLAKITAQPIMAAHSAVAAAGIIGPDLAPVERAVERPDLTGMWLALRSDPFASGVLSAFFRGVARALGRIYADTGVARGATYDYRVVFTDPAGKETAHMLTGRVRVAEVAPPAPTGLSAHVGDRVVTLTWKYAPSNSDSADEAVGFHVYRADSVGAAFRRLTTVPVLLNRSAPLTFRDGSVENGTRYRYRVTAVDLVQREGPPSAVLDVTPKDDTPPAAPVGVVASATPAGVQLVWRLAPEPDAAGYAVERSQAIRGTFTQLTPALIPVSSPAYRDSTVIGGHRYYYHVIAVDRSGNTSAPSNVVDAIIPDTVAPPEPRGVAARVVHHRLEIAWHPSKAADLRGYWVYRIEDSVRTFRLSGQPVTDTVFADSGYGGRGLRPGTRYLVAVSAVDSASNESARDTVTVVVPDDVAPPHPSDLQARGVGGRYVALSWSQDPASDLAGFTLARARGDSEPVLIGKYPAGALSARDTSARHGAVYRYLLTAVDTAGNASVPATDTLRFTRPSPPPPPRHIAVRVTAAGVRILWERVADPELAGYRVYRSAVPTGTYRLVGATGAGVTTFADTGAVARTARAYYDVRAVDTSGNESAPSRPVRGGSQ